ncbi:MAG: hypothetical protein K0B87_07035 [Candidatus Syntrophosphaera sp.]|nr:hypothetical protein [Candidatus Syntrophosphaera sp.]
MNDSKNSASSKPKLRVSSRPQGAEIFRGGTFTGKVTPHEFSGANFVSGAYSVQMEGYRFEPQECTVNPAPGTINIRFTGNPTELALTVASTPPGAEIFRGGAFTGKVTPHEFKGDHFVAGSYYVQKEGFRFEPQEIEVNSLSENTKITFKGFPVR